MREILFRAKETFNGEWVEGYYEFGYDSETEKPAHYMWVLNHTEKYGDMFMVIPETVGQYTGRNVGADKLFEGDIIEWVEDYDDNWGDSKTYIGRSLVIWDNDNSCWAVKTDTYIQFFNDFSWDRCYVIGNIHDNKELLEVK